MGLGVYSILDLDICLLLIMHDFTSLLLYHLVFKSVTVSHLPVYT